MGTLTLKVEADPGADISNAFRKAIHIAKKLDINVEFEFNSVICVANKFSTVKIGVEQFHNSIRNNRPYALAYFRPKADNWFKRQWISRDWDTIVILLLIGSYLIVKIILLVL